MRIIWNLSPMELFAGGDGELESIGEVSSASWAKAEALGKAYHLVVSMRTLTLPSRG